MRNVKFMLHWLQTMLTIVACLAFLWLGAQYIFGVRILAVQTASMRPSFRPGDALVMQPLKPSQLKAGDIVSYKSARNPNELVTHRVVQIDKATGSFRTKGDALHVPDPIVRDSLLVGRARVILPGLGRTLSWFRTWPALILCVYLPAAIIVVTELMRLERHYHRPYRLKQRQDAIVLV